MKRQLLSYAFALAVPALFAGPVVTVTKTEQPSGSRYLVIDYELTEEAAIVTLDVCTNGVSIGKDLLVNAIGDVNRKVEPGTRQIKWNARKTWPNRVIDDGSVTAKLTAWALNCPPPYLVLSLDGVTPPAYYESADLVPGGVSNNLYKTDKILMKKIPAAYVSWRMGSTGDETGHEDGWILREVSHQVVLSADYYMGVYEVTKRQYKLATGNAGGGFQNYEDSPRRPAGQIQGNILRGSTADGIDWPSTGTNVTSGSVIGCFRVKTCLDALDLPTEAQWEFACRAGCTTALYNGKDVPNSAWQDGKVPWLEPLGWFSANAATETTDGIAQPHEVGLKEPNGFGLYDMLGNVYEWCLDWDSQGAAYSDGRVAADPKGVTTPGSTTYRICRGGCYEYSGAICRAAYRGKGDMNNSWFDRFGFRLCCPAIVK